MPKVIRGGTVPKTFKQFLRESAEKDQAFRERIQLFEHEVYKSMGGSQGSFREDPGNTNTMTIRHSHVFAKPKGRGGQLYAVNIDGSGHDGSSGTSIPASHADFFRSKGYAIPDTNILECLDPDELKEDKHSLMVLQD
jgi:hypothetical protein